MRSRTPLLTLKPGLRLGTSSPYFIRDHLPVLAVIGSGLVAAIFAVIWIVFETPPSAPPPPPAKPAAAVKPFVPPPDSYPIPVRTYTSGGFPFPGTKVHVLSFMPGEDVYDLLHVQNVEILDVSCGEGERSGQLYIHVRLTPEQQREIKRAADAGEVFAWVLSQTDLTAPSQ